MIIAREKPKYSQENPAALPLYSPQPNYKYLTNQMHDAESILKSLSLL
jgi:hypothetical protein